MKNQGPNRRQITNNDQMCGQGNNTTAQGGFRQGYYNGNYQEDRQSSFQYQGHYRSDSSYNGHLKGKGHSEGQSQYEDYNRGQGHRFSRYGYRRSQHRYSKRNTNLYRRTGLSKAQITPSPSAAYEYNPYIENWVPVDVPY